MALYRSNDGGGIRYDGEVSSQLQCCSKEIYPDGCGEGSMAALDDFIDGDLGPIRVSFDISSYVGPAFSTDDLSMQ